MRTGEQQVSTIGKGTYQVQLLLTADAARYVRKLALRDVADGTSVNQDEEDYAYAIIAEVAQGLRRNG